MFENLTVLLFLLKFNSTQSTGLCSLAGGKMKYFLEEVTHEPSLQGYIGVSQAKLEQKIKVRHSHERGQHQQRHRARWAKGLNLIKNARTIEYKV